MYDETYSLSLITEWAQKNNFSFKYSSANVDFLIVEHGIRLALPGKFKLSIQTHPIIVNSAFAETALIYKGNVVYTYDIMEYDDCQRFESPTELFSHIVELNELLEDHEEIDTNSLKLKNGKQVNIK